MCPIQIQVQCYDRFFEVLPEEGEQAEFFIEDAVGHVLMHYFEEASVDDVMIHFTRGFHPGFRHCFFTVYARCACERFVVPSCSDEVRKRILEEALVVSLKEFFVSVNIHAIVLDHARWECKRALVLSRGY